MSFKLTHSGGEAVEVAPIGSERGFTLPLDRFEGLLPGEYRYSLLCNAKTLEFVELIVDMSGAEPIQGPTNARMNVFMGHEDWDDDDLQAHLEMLEMLEGMAEGDVAFDVALAELMETSEAGTTARQVAEDVYLELATMTLVDSEVRKAVRSKLAAGGLRSFLPPRVGHIRLAASLSLLQNVAGTLEEYVPFLITPGELGFDVDRFAAMVSEILAADPHQVVFRRHGDRITWSI